MCIGKKESHHFTREFKMNTVALLIDIGMPAGKVVHELYVHSNLLHQWKRKFLAEGNGGFVEVMKKIGGKLHGGGRE